MVIAIRIYCIRHAIHI